MAFLKYFLLVFCFVSFAEAKVVDPCLKIIETACPSIVGKEGIVRWTCLSKQYSVLNKDCKSQLDEETKDSPCLISTLLYCPQNAKSSRSNTNLFCLAKKYDDLTVECKKVLDARPRANALIVEFQKACKEEYQTLCKGLEGEAANDCIRKNYQQNNVSAKCKKILHKYRPRG